jgi:hypothetical protein
MPAFFMTPWAAFQQGHASLLFRNQVASHFETELYDSYLQPFPTPATGPSHSQLGLHPTTPEA